MLKDLVLKNRSYRRFDESRKIDEAVLRELVDLARITPSAANKQPLKYKLISTPDDAVFETLGWAAYLKDWKGPVPGERPAAYIVVLTDRTIDSPMGIDPGIVAQTIMLGAVERGFGGCIIGSIAKRALRVVLGLPERYEIALVLALGHPVEQVALEELGNDDIRYWRDLDGVHHVPKRRLDDIILP